MSAVSSRQKLAACLAMLGSSFDGEVLAAARAAERLRREAGVSWREIVDPPASQPLPPPPKREPPRADWRDTVAQCLRQRGSLRPWEVGFLENLPNFARLSAKQSNCLNGIAQRVLRERAR